MMPALWSCICTRLFPMMWRQCGLPIGMGACDGCNGLRYVEPGPSRSAEQIEETRQWLTLKMS